MKSLDTVWYGRNPLSLVLLPLAWLFCAVAISRRLFYRMGWLKSYKLPVPVIVVGNIALGGTGKTPLVIWLVEFLRRNGYTPGVVSRGYGGRAESWPQQVSGDSDPRLVSDEAVLIAQRGGCPVVVGPDRVAAARALLASAPCDVIVSDDGLQHYALARDIEIGVVDGVRRHGNRRCLPAGPLREPVSRLKTVDLIVANGVAQAGEYAMQLKGDIVHHLADAHTQALSAFNGQKIHAVAGTGHPQRFFTQLRAAGLSVIEHAYRDHHDFSPADIDFGDDLPVIMTEKDAVKCRRFAQDRHWYLPVAAELDEHLAEQLKRLLDERAHQRH